MEEMIERANATNYGLAAGILTKDINKVYLEDGFSTWLFLNLY